MENVVFAVIGIVCLLFVVGIPALNSLVKGPLHFRETPGGSPWFGPWYYKLAFHFGLGYQGEVDWTVSFEELPSERKTSKIGGLSAIYPSMLWPWTARRVQRYGRSEWPDFAHENSWRFVAHLGKEEAGFSTYTYTGARGGIGPEDQEKPERVGLGRIQEGEEARLRIVVRSGSVLYECTTPRGGTQSHVEALECRPWAFWKHFAHSRGVTDDTPVPIVMKVEKTPDT